MNQLEGSKRLLIAALCLISVACGGGSSSTSSNTSSSGQGSSSSGEGSASGAPAIAGCFLFPDTAVFNQRVDDTSRFPAHPASSTWISLIGGARNLHADWGLSEDQQNWQTYFGIPFNVVNGTSLSWSNISFQIIDPRAGNGIGVPEESDCAIAQAIGGFTIERGCNRFAANQLRFPFPDDASIKAESGSCNDPQQCGDRHVLVLESTSCRLWESYFSYKQNNQWTAYSTAAWVLNSNLMRPNNWTSADAAGLPILPLLVRVAEANADDIRHAFRVTFRDDVLANTHVWPARHHAGNATPNGIPFGSRLRLRGDFVIPANWSTQAKAIARAMQRYGLLVADIGSDLYVQGEPSTRWSSQTVSQIQSLRMDSFEFVSMESVTGDARFNLGSFQASW